MKQQQKKTKWGRQRIRAWIDVWINAWTWTKRGARGVRVGQSKCDPWMEIWFIWSIKVMLEIEWARLHTDSGEPVGQWDEPNLPMGWTKSNNNSSVKYIYIEYVQVKIEINIELSICQKCLLIFIDNSIQMSIFQFRDT